ncbi:metallophosphoesterase family protein [Planktotalea arctica]|uniref:metallophosphoesterase family protein n=1 Tax=Planktotalea arctica TaxID=1481893 RepID=UPI000A172FEF|nr:metallophosphoesterase family protein [Planktotalea arctica]
MLKRLQSLFTRSPATAVMAPQSKKTILSPDTPFYAIGDIHGCLIEMNLLIETIEAENSDATIVFLGDYIDRGSKSAQVLARLHDLQTRHPNRIICLMGNHERMMLEFIDDPLGRGARWLANGGMQTLGSLGIKQSKARLKAEDAMEIADQLEETLPGGMQDWLRALPMLWSNGNVHCVHAAMDPSASPKNQKERHLLWGHSDFMKIPREDAECVIFGHVIVPAPDVRDGRIAIDTGAYKTGRLTAVHIDQSGWRFLQS